MSLLSSSTVEPYARPDLSRTIFSAFTRAGSAGKALRRDDLVGLGEFHNRGREATRLLAELAGIGPSDRVLDLGSGLGGAARTLARERGSRVVGLERIESYRETAEMLTRRLGLEHQVRFLQGDARAMPFDAHSFDVVWLQHVNVSIEDKARLLGEIKRVIRPGGRLAMHELCAGSSRPIHFPIPWADGPSTSFLSTAEDWLHLAEDQGLRLKLWHSDSIASRDWLRARLDAMRNRPESAPMALSVDLLMGDHSECRLENLLRNLEEDKLRVVMGVFERP